MSDNTGPLENHCWIVHVKFCQHILHLVHRAVVSHRRKRIADNSISKLQLSTFHRKRPLYVSYNYDGTKYGKSWFRSVLSLGSSSSSSSSFFFFFFFAG